MPAPSGEQYVLSLGASSAVVTEVGATLRQLSLDSVEVLMGFAEDEMCSGGKGQVLSPWPNRLEDGSYEFAGRPARAAIDDPEHGSAIHGLVRWLPWTLLERSAGSLTLGLVLHPSPGYPYRIAHALTYALEESGLVVTAEVRNESSAPVPYGLGFHPYLVAPSGSLSECSLEVAAARHLLLDGRGLPVASEAVADSPYARIAEGVWPAAGGGSAGTLEGVVLDECFTDLSRASDGRSRARFAPTDGPARILWSEAPFHYLMCFTGDTLEGKDRRRGVALEPMTCPPNALRTGDGLVVLEPGEVGSARFGIALEA